MLFNKLKTVLGTMFNNILECCTSPLERLEYQRDMLEEDRRKTLESLTELETNIRTLENNQAATQKAINEAQQAAKEAVKQGLDDSAKKILTRKISLESTFESNKEYLAKIRESLTNLKLKIKEYEADIDNVNASITQLKTESKIAEVKVKIAETTSGIGMNTYEINKDLQKGRAIADEQNARADAIEQLNAEGMYDGLRGKGGVDGEIASLISGTNAEAELIKIKQELSEEATKAETLDKLMDEN